MYYSQPCSYCSRVFYTFDDDRDRAAHALFRGIKAHLQEYDEDEKEHKYDDGENVDSNYIYKEMVEGKEPPSGGYKL